MKTTISPKKQLIEACVMMALILAVLISAVSSFAWFSQNKKSTVTGSVLRVTADPGILVGDIVIIKANDDLDVTQDFKKYIIRNQNGLHSYAVVDENGTMLEKELVNETETAGANQLQEVISLNKFDTVFTDKNVNTALYIAVPIYNLQNAGCRDFDLTFDIDTTIKFAAGEGDDLEDCKVLSNIVDMSVAYGIVDSVGTVFSSNDNNDWSAFYSAAETAFASEAKTPFVSVSGTPAAYTRNALSFTISGYGADDMTGIASSAVTGDALVVLIRVDYNEDLVTAFVEENHIDDLGVSVAEQGQDLGESVKFDCDIGTISIILSPKGGAEE